MRILIAPDKFKGSLSATIVAQTIAGAFRAYPGRFEVDLCPIADGGEGTAEAIITAKNGSWVECQTVDAQNRPVMAKYGLITGSGPTEAVMEMSAASGLAMVSDIPLNPATASTYGTGLMMLDAIRCGAGRIIIGIGGSATNDGGTGMARALGFRFLTEAGLDLGRLPQDLDGLHRVENGSNWSTEVLVACDVTNPLLGPEGCTRVYGPQKGVKDFAFFESRLERLVQIVGRELHVNPAALPGAGAAGGLGYGLMAFCGARLTSGFDLIADLIDLRRRLQAADLVITGEGRMDAQTLHGKGPMGVARLAREFGKPMAAIAGLIEAREALSPWFDHLVQIKPADMPVEEAMRRGGELLASGARELAAHVVSL
ncbi:MAG: glycerate kinase [Verrucomicrobiaceae bacterium]|nr:glycerate kinase [Verrucomicrobiaceae bacterium]